MFCKGGIAYQKILYRTQDMTELQSHFDRVFLVIFGKYSFVKLIFKITQFSRWQKQVVCFCSHGLNIICMNSIGVLDK